MAAPAAAQSRVTTGVRLPTADVAANDHAEALEDNVAGIGFGAGADFTYAFTGTGRDAPDQGNAFFLALRLIGAWHTGVGVQFLQQPGDQDNEPVKISWGNALRLSDSLSIGLNWSSFIADESPVLSGLDALDFGAMYRPWRWLAAGLAIYDFNTPKVAGAPLPRQYDLGLALRPGLESVTLSGNVLLQERDDPRPVYGARALVGLPGPFSLVGRWDTGKVGDHRTQSFFVGLTDEIADRVTVGGFAYLPDANESDKRVGASVLVRGSSVPEPERPLLKPPYVVEVGIDGDLGEYGSGGLFASEPATPFLDLMRELRALGKRDDVAAVLLSFADPDLGWARADELYDAIRDLHAAGKRVYAYVTVADTLAYSVASAADKVYLAPSGGLLITGVRAEPLYLGELLDRVGVKPQFVAIGEFKTAPEMFTRREPSEPGRVETNNLLDQFYGRIVEHIAGGRNLPAERVRALIDGAPYTAAKAKEAGLVDGVIHYDEMERIARQDLGPRFRFAQAGDVLPVRHRRWGEAAQIAMLYAAGTITDGESFVNPFTGTVTVGADTFVRAARTLRDDPQVKAVVLRIDSPGGSVTAADAMWRELKLLSEAKPIVVSMGDVAASGGYYIAVAGGEILASPATITGSIGIFTGKFDLSGLYWLLGVSREQFTRGAHADLLSTMTQWGDDELRIVREGMEALYHLFLERVSAGRQGLSIDAVDAIGRGRVWTGAQARACGLVDRPAGILTAIDLAAVRAGLGEGDYELAVYPRTSGFGGLPRSPVHILDDLGARLAALRGEAQPPGAPSLTHVATWVRPLLDLPLLHFHSGQALALLPFTIVR